MAKMAIAHIRIIPWITSRSIASVSKQSMLNSKHSWRVEFLPW